MTVDKSETRNQKSEGKLNRASPGAVRVRREARAGVLGASTRASPLSKLQRLARRFQEALFEFNETHSDDAMVKMGIHPESYLQIPGGGRRFVWHGSAPLRKLVLIDMNSLQNSSKTQIQRPGSNPASRWSKPGFSPGLTGFGRVCPALTGYNFEQHHCHQWAAGRILTLPSMVGTSRCDVPARVPAGGTTGQACPPCTILPSPDAALGDWDGAARQSLPTPPEMRARSSRALVLRFASIVRCAQNHR